MAIVFGKIKCYLCGEKDGVMECVCAYGIYGEAGERIFYHDECLELVERYAESCGHRQIDKAIHINELRENCIKYNKEIEPRFKKKLEKLKQKNFERMIPRFRRE
jgi:hypothetical protein